MGGRIIIIISIIIPSIITIIITIVITIISIITIATIRASFTTVITCRRHPGNSVYDPVSNRHTAL